MTALTRTHPSTAIEPLLAGAIDYAGLFPPARLPMAEAVPTYAEGLEGPQQWMLGRFIVPAAELELFAARRGEAGVARPESAAWRLSATVPAASCDAFESAIAAIEHFNHRERAKPGGPAAYVDTIEGRASTAEEVDRAVRRIPRDWTAFFEIPADDRLPQRLAELAAAGHAHGRPVHAKLRTGGVQPEAIPPIAAVAEFLHACAAHGLAFKATAGLHHPLRGEHPLDEYPEAPRGTLHGFLNVFLAALAARLEDAPVATLEAILGATHPRPLEVSGGGIRWETSSFAAAGIDRIRREFALSFGSCSFREPVEDLQKLGLIPR